MDSDSALGHVLYLWTAMAAGGYFAFAVYRRLPWTEKVWQFAGAAGISVIGLALVGVMTGSINDFQAMHTFLAIWPAVFLKSLLTKADREANAMR